MMIAKHVRKLAGYVPGEQPKSENVIKLNTNENAYPPPPACTKTIHAFSFDSLRRYCDPLCTELRGALSKVTKACSERIFVGNGSDEILSLAARAFVENDEAIASLDPSYSLYKTLAEIRNVPWYGFREPADALKRQAKPIALFLLTNPNAPTGEFRDPRDIAAFAKKFKGVVIVDEAYAEFARGNCMSLANAKDNRNIIVLRTFSKSFSLAGLRVGYCVGPKPLIDALYKIKDSYNVDALAQRIAIAALRDISRMRENVRKIVTTRNAFTADLENRGWDVIPSESNFVFARPAHLPAATLFDELRRRNIYVRYFRGPKTGDRLRVTIGTDNEMKRLLKAIDELDIEK